MNTVIQQLISDIKDNYDKLSQEGKNFADVFFLTKAPTLLHQEKEQLERYFNAGYDYRSSKDRDVVLEFGENCCDRFEDIYKACQHTFLQTDSQFKKCTVCGMIDAVLK